MANYLGDYTTDSSKELKLVLLKTYFVTISSDNRESRTDTDYDFDSLYLPSIFIEKTRRGDIGCPFNIGRKRRYAKFWLSSSEYLQMDLPFKPGTLNYNQFFIELNDLRVLTIGLEGEKIEHYYLELFTK